MSETHNETHTEPLTPLEQQAAYLLEKEKLLTRYKALEPELEYAMDDVERGHIESKRGKLAKKIKVLAAQIREYESMEQLA